MTLQDAECGVTLWFAFPQEWHERSLATEVRQCLGAEEIVRMEKMRFPEGKRLFAVSHLLVRRALERHGELPAREWRFAVGGHGKPAIVPGQGVSGLHFNLAHTRGVAVVAVTRLGEVGVDVERTERQVDAAGLIRRFFAPGETARLVALPPERLRGDFFLYWTLKEAALKATGEGLALPLKAVAFNLSGQRPYHVAYDGPVQSKETAWRFAVIEPRQHPYLAAICVEDSRLASVTIETRRLLPSAEVGHLDCAPVAFSPGVTMVPGDT